MDDIKRRTDTRHNTEDTRLNKVENNEGKCLKGKIIEFKIVVEQEQ